MENSNVKVAFRILEEIENDDTWECCPQCASLGIIHFEDTTTVPNMAHRCFRCNWSWDGCTFSDGKTSKDRLNSIRGL